MSAEAVAAVLEAIEASEPAGLQTPLPKRFCFVEGTHIATLRGEMPVQGLRIGDNIRAKKGSFHVVSDVAIYAYDELDPEVQAKIGLHQVMRGAVDEGLPRRDYFVTEGQQFELSRRLEIAHAVRMTVRRSGAALRGFRFVVFACEGLPMIRAEGIWTTLTPVERAFALVPPGAVTEEAQSPEHGPSPRPVSDPASARRPTRRRLSRLLSRPASVPGSHHIATGTPDP
jgi:hypothetical protein